MNKITRTDHSGECEARRNAPIEEKHGNARLRQVVGVFQEHLYLPNADPVLVNLGTTAGNLLDGDPVWLLSVGPPGSGRTEIVQAMDSLKCVHATSNITEAGLLSGSPSKERANDATGGLLMKIGVNSFGIILCKDFGSVLNMHRDGRNSVLAALREVYDGSWTRVLGTDGGRSIKWRGKVGFLGACTQSIDTCHAVMAAMGERFILYRMPRLAPEAEEEQAIWAYRGSQTIEQVRLKLACAVLDFFKEPLVDPRKSETGPDTERLLVDLAILVARCRSSVQRDGYRRDIELIPSPEVPTRIMKALGQLHAGLLAIGLSPAETQRLVLKVGLDCLPIVRRLVLDRFILRPQASLTVEHAGQGLAYSNSKVRRQLQELEAHGVLERTHGGADLWGLTSWARTKLAAVGLIPEMSDDTKPVPEMSGAVGVPDSSDRAVVPGASDPVSEVSEGHAGSISSKDEEDKSENWISIDPTE